MEIYKIKQAYRHLIFAPYSEYKKIDVLYFRINPDGEDFVTELKDEVFELIEQKDRIKVIDLSIESRPAPDSEAYDIIMRIKCNRICITEIGHPLQFGQFDKFIHTFEKFLNGDLVEQ